MLVTVGRRQGAPATPAWFSDTVELWARTWGRNATTRWEPAMGCFVTFFSRRPTDPVLQAVQEGRRDDEGEPHYWHEWKEGVRQHPLSGKMVGGWVATDIEQLGESGVRERLDRGNLWSGRGEHASLEAVAEAQEAANRRTMEAKRAMLRDATRDPLRATIRHAKGLPTVSVPEQITSTQE